MPRRDRRFTGEDIRRLYCKNLTPLQRHFFDITDCDWDDYDPVEKTTKFLEALFDSGLMDEVELYLPGTGKRIKQFAGLALFLLKGGDLTEIDYVPVSFFDKLGGLIEQTVDALEALGGSEAFQGLIHDLIDFSTSPE